MLVVNDCCDLSALCPMHLDDAFAQLRGVAQSRGHQWALELEQRGLRGEWPEVSDRVMAIAEQKVADLTRDNGLRKRLAVEAVRAARARWLRGPAETNPPPP